MPRKQKMPEDVRRMTAEMRKAHDNPDPRPQLRRGNPKAVDVEEMKAQLRVAREDESTPEQAALRGYAQALREGKVVEGGLGAAATIAPMVAGMFVGKGPNRPGRVSSRKLSNYIKNNPFNAPTVLADDVNYAALEGFHNVRYMTLDDLSPWVLRHKTAGISSALVPPGTAAMYHDGYGYDKLMGNDISGGARVYLTPEYTVPNKDMNIVTFNGDAATSNTRKFFTPFDFRHPARGRRPRTFAEMAGIMERDLARARANGVDYVLDGSSGLPRSFYETLLHPYPDYLENKIYDVVPFSRQAIGGVALEEGSDPSGWLRRELDRQRIPWEFYKSQWMGRVSPATRTELEVQKDLAPVTHMASKGGNASGKSGASKAPKETYDTPIPDDLRPAYDAWYGQLPKNLQYTGDYDLQGAWLERLGQPTKYEETQNGHLDDYGKKPNHPTFSSGSKWHDPKVPERTGGEWKKSRDGSWDFYPGSGNVLTDEQLKDYFDKYEKGNRVHPRDIRQAAKAGDAGKSGASSVPSGHNAALDGYSGPRIVINPSTFKNEKDGLCVAFDEAFRILMEVNGFDPVAEPTEKQRKFFSDTAYANDERMLRRTILARICTFDTSVTDPTDEQLQEAVEFLETVMEIGAPQNEWEQSAVQRIRDTVEKAVGQPA